MVHKCYEHERQNERKRSLAADHALVVRSAPAYTPKGSP